MRKALLAAVCALALGGCSLTLDSVTGWLNRTDAAVMKYAPIIGKDLLMVANILITAECSPLTPVAGQAASNILQIVAPNKPAANKVSTILATNAAVAEQLCPLVSAIRASVGPVPQQITPSQIIPAPQ